MRKFFAPLFIAAIAIVSFQCGPSQEQEAQQLVKQLTDSIMKAEAIAQQHTNDSVHRADSIRSLPCPELAEYIRLSDRGIAMMKTATTDEDIKRVNKTMDSITAVEKKLTGHLDKMEPHCRRRYLALSLIYTRDLTNGLMDLMGPVGQIAHPKNEAEDRHTDSLAKAIEFGE